MAELNLTSGQRLWIYQRERFPVLTHGVLIAAFSSSAICFSALLRGSRAFPPPAILAAGFLSSFLLFLQLRIADEHKDAEDDAKYRPYRAVPRGVVTLRQLAVTGGIACVLQVALAIAVSPNLLPLLAVVWAWLFLMSREFFVPQWLRARPLTYLASHMVIMPLIDLYISAFDWMHAQGVPPSGLGWFLFVSFFNGVVVEIGRKVRAPAEEEHGVETYSALYGFARAAVAWFGAMGITAAFAYGAATALGDYRADGLLYGCILAVAAFVTIRYARRPERERARSIEQLSGLWTLVMYVSLGLGPMTSLAIRR